MRKIFLLAGMVMISVGAAVSAQAQAPVNLETLSPELAAVLAREVPLTQADIEVYMKFLPRVPQAAGNENSMTLLFQSTGLTESRFLYVFGKIPIAFDLASGSSAQDLKLDQVPPALRPTPDETALVKKNIEPLRKAFAGAATAMSR